MPIQSPLSAHISNPPILHRQMFNDCLVKCCYRIKNHYRLGLDMVLYRLKHEINITQEDDNMSADPTMCHVSTDTPIPAVAEDFRRVRDYSMRVAAPLSDEDCCAQSMCNASPIKWHLAHTSWFFETFVLEPYEQRFVPFNRAFRMLFNSYYESVGEQYPRSRRGMLTRPSLEEIRMYRADVDRRVLGLLVRWRECDPKCLSLVELGLQHEQQHQELMLTDLKHLLSLNPLEPAYLPPGSDESAVRPVAAAPKPVKMEWLKFASDLLHIGHKVGTGFCFDNELPRHLQFVESFSCAMRLVTNAEYLAFVERGGYSDPEHWLSAGWEWVRSTGTAHPLYWRRPSTSAGGGWREFTLHGSRPLDPDAAVTHVSYYEADAFARWSGARLPTEAEWERAAVTWYEDNHEHTQFFGTVWQWTSSAYAAFPGYVTPPGAVGEYNGKFMVNQYVLRGSSAVTPAGHSRLTYRNFFPAETRWQYTGIRLAMSYH